MTKTTKKADKQMLLWYNKYSKNLINKGVLSIPRRITKEELSDHVNRLSLPEFLTIIDRYSDANSVDMDKVKLELVQKDIQKHLTMHGVNSRCPYCDSKMIVKNGYNGAVVRFKCQNCQKRFSLFTGTIMEKTKFSWDIWVKVMEMILNNLSLDTMTKVLIDDFKLYGLDRRTVSTWRHKITHSMAMMPMPKLSGVIQIDETFFRESQKGAKQLVSLVPDTERKPRYGRVASQLGSMGNEFATVVCMVDAQGYAVAKMTGLGKLDIETFVNEFDEYIENPSYICADGSFVYTKYCDLKGYDLYVRPSNYVDTVNKATDRKTPEEANKALLELYKNQMLDYMFLTPSLPYDEFNRIKTINGLSLSRVNQFHSYLKEHLKTETHGITTKFLPDYIGAYVYIRNWNIKHGHLPVSNKDAEEILIDLLKNGNAIKIADIENAKMTDKMTSSRYMKLLKQKTETAREITGNHYFKFDEEDGVINFNVRHFLEKIPQYKLDILRKKYRIPKKWAKYAIISKLIQMPNISNDIIVLIDECKPHRISDEDLDAQEAKRLMKLGLYKH